MEIRYTKSNMEQVDHFPSDKELWEAFRIGDANALFELYKRLYIPLVNYGVKLSGDKTSAQDVFGDLMISLWDKRAQLAEVHNVKSYLMTTLRHRFYAEFKNKDKFVEVNDTHGGQQLPYEQVIIDSQEQEVLRKNLRSAFSKLTPRQSQFITMRFYEGLSYEEIADATGVDIKAVYNKVYEGLKILRKELPEKHNHIPDFLILLLILGPAALA